MPCLVVSSAGGQIISLGDWGLKFQAHTTSVCLAVSLVSSMGADPVLVSRCNLDLGCSSRGDASISLSQIRVF